MDTNNDIIKYKPGWLVRNGTMLLLIVIVVFVIISFFIPYPRVLNLQAKVVSESATGTYSLLVPGSIVKAPSKVKRITFLNGTPGENQLLKQIISVSNLTSNPDSTILKTDWKTPVTSSMDSMQGKIIGIQIVYYDQRLSAVLWRQLRQIFKLN